MLTVNSKNSANMEPAPGRRSDLRLHHRYPIALDLNYKVLQRGRDFQGSGRTLNISSRGVLLETNSLLPPAARSIELAIKWPFLLEGCPLKLVMRGYMVRRIGKYVAVEADSYEIRTARRAVT